MQKEKLNLLVETLNSYHNKEKSEIVIRADNPNTEERIREILVNGI